MNEKLKKSALLLTLLTLFLLLFLVFKVELFVVKTDPIENDTGSDNVSKHAQLKKISNEEYMAKVKNIVRDYESLIVNKETGNLAENPELLIKLNNLMDDLQDTFVPDSNYKKLHLNLTLSLSKMINYVKNQDENSRKNAIDLLDKNKLDYEWLNL